jgi:hypothetical protein
VSEDQKPPPEWPQGRQDYTRLKELANWVEDHLVKEHQKLSELREERNPIPEGAADDEIWLMKHERQMLLDAFEKKDNCGRRWSAVAAHLLSPEKSPRFVVIVAGLIEYNGFHTRLELGQEFRRRVRVFELYQSVRSILQRDYSNAKSVDNHAKWLTVVLSDKAEWGTPDSKLYNERYKEVKKLITDFNRRHNNREKDELYEIVYSVWYDHAR